jgi:hypothetical protein
MKKILMITLAFAAAGIIRAEMAPVDGSNEVGFSSVPASAGDNSIITVPYVACLDNDGDVMLADLVSTNGLVAHADTPGAADQLIVLTTNSLGVLRYGYYWLDSDVGWVNITTSVKQPNGPDEAFDPGPAADFPISRGKGFWLKRVASSTADVYVKGESSASNPSTAIVDGLNLVGYGTAAEMTLNSVSWTGADGGNGLTTTSDKIIVVESDGSLSYYYYFIDPGWGGAYAALSGNWINEDYTVANVTVPAGKGFWYLRRDGGTFNFQPDGN